MIHFILPGSKIRPQQIGRRQHRLRQTRVSSRRKLKKIPQRDAGIVTHGGVWWVIYGWQPSIHSPTLGPGQHLKKRRGAPLRQRVRVLCSKGIQSRGNGRDVPGVSTREWNKMI